MEDGKVKRLLATIWITLKYALNILGTALNAGLPLMSLGFSLSWAMLTEPTPQTFKTRDGPNTKPPEICSSLMLKPTSACLSLF